MNLSCFTTNISNMILKTALLAVLVCFAHGLQIVTPPAERIRKYACPSLQFTKDDETHLQNCRNSLPLKTGIRLNQVSQQPFYLFLLAEPYSGSSALQSLILTSPRITSLCAANTWQCEGTWTLVDNQILPYEQRWTPNILNWTQVLNEYEKIWSKGPKGAYIRLDKSPPNIAKVSEIADHFASAKSQVAFIILTRSPCNSKFYSDRDKDHDSQMLLDGLATLRRNGYKTLELKYEDLLMKPCGAATEVLNFLPELESLNPGVSGYPADWKWNTTDRQIPLLDYAMRRARSRDLLTIQQSLSEPSYTLVQRMGYGTLSQLPDQ